MHGNGTGAFRRMSVRVGWLAQTFHGADFGGDIISERASASMIDGRACGMFKT